MTNRFRALLAHIRMMSKNLPFVLVVIATLFASVGVAMTSAILFFLVDVYLQMGDQLPLVGAISLFAGAASLGLWVLLFNRLSKQQAWILLMVLMALSALLFTRLSPGEEHNLAYLICISMLYNCPAAALWALAPSLLSDAVDYDSVKSGHSRAGVFFSVYSFALKSSMALAASLALAVAAWYGFDATASTHSAQHVLGLHLSVGYLPIVCYLLSAAVIFFNPITAQRHRIIRRRLDARAQYLIEQ